MEPYSIERRIKKRVMRNSSAPLQRIADEKIMEEMNTGGFRGIQGKGTPIRNEPATHVLDNLDEKLNKVLINSGCVPDWIALDKNIREEIAKLKGEVREAWKRCRSAPLNRSVEERWEEERQRFRDRTDNINDKIRKLNLEVPSVRLQRVLLKCDDFVERITSEIDQESPCVDSSTPCVTHATVSRSEEHGGDDKLRTEPQRTEPTTFTLTGTVRGWVSAIVQRFLVGSK